jgi:hypothetical protein
VAAIIPGVDELILRTIVIQFDGRVVEVFGNKITAAVRAAQGDRQPRLRLPPPNRG